MARVVVVNEWWRVVVRLSPELDLVGAVLLGCFDLAQSLKCSIMSLIQFPRLHRLTLIKDSHFFEDQLVGPDSSP